MNSPAISLYRSGELISLLEMISASIGEIRPALVHFDYIRMFVRALGDTLPSKSDIKELLERLENVEKMIGNLYSKKYDGMSNEHILMFIWMLKYTKLQTI